MVTDAGEASSTLNVECCGGGGRRWEASSTLNVAVVADAGRHPRHSTWRWWQTLGGILDTQRGRAEDGGESVLDAPHRVTWQSGGQWQALGEAS